MFKSLRNKFLMINMLSISAVVVVALVIIYLVMYNNMLLENKANLEASQPAVHMEGSQEGGHGEEYGSNEVVTNQRVYAGYSDSFGISVDSEGNVLEVQPMPDLPEDTYKQAAALAWAEQKDNSTISLNGMLWQYIIREAEQSLTKVENGVQTTETVDTGVYTITFLDVTAGHESMQRTLTLLIIVGAGMVAVVFLLSLLFANRAIKPIAAAWDKQKQFVADASHELKTPLAVVNANADAMLSVRSHTIAREEKWLHYIKQETGRMAGLVSGMLQLATADDADRERIAEDVDFSAVVGNMLLSMEALFFDKGLSLENEIQPEVMVCGNADGLKQLVMILLDNAMKYSERGGSVTVTLAKWKKQAVLSVKNTGAGIPAEKLEKLFDRFYRGDPSRSAQTPGYGLGLSLAKAITQQMNGKLRAESVPGQYTVFTISIPVE